MNAKCPMLQDLKIRWLHKKLTCVISTFIVIIFTSFKGVIRIRINWKDWRARDRNSFMQCQSIDINNMKTTTEGRGWRLHIIHWHIRWFLVIALTKTIEIMETIMWFCWFFSFSSFNVTIIFTWLIIVIHTQTAAK